MKRTVAAIALAMMMLGSTGAAASARPLPENVECLFYQTFAPREPGDCIVP